MTVHEHPEGSTRGGFTSEDRVPPLDYDLAPYGPAGRIADRQPLSCTP